MTRLVDALMPALPAERLALVRIAVGLYVLQDLVRVRTAAIGVGRTAVTMWDPVGVTTLLPGPLSPGDWAITYDVAIAVCIAWTLGLGWRVIGPAFAALLLFVWTYRVSWQMLYHVHHLAMLHVLVLGLAPDAARAWSGDAAIVRWRAARSDVGAPATALPADWRYGWPLVLMSIVTVTTYCLAGIAKVQLVGPQWALGDNLLQQVAYDGVYKAVLAQPSDEPTPLIRFAFEHPWIMPPLSALALGLELFAPVALLHRRVGCAWCVLTLGMHWGIHAFMNLVFPYPLFGVAFLSFVATGWRTDSAAPTGDEQREQAKADPGATAAG